MAKKLPTPIAPPLPAPAVANDGPLYPGGEDSPAYRWAFNAFVLLTLLEVCVGLANYLGWYLTSRWGG